MKIKKKKLLRILEKVEKLISSAKKYEKHFRSEIETIHPEYKKSAINLVHYIALRGQDIRDLQDDLGDLGLSRLGKAEAHVMASLQAIKSIISRLLKQKEGDYHKPVVSIKKGKKLIRRLTVSLLGKKIKGSRTRIMVTLPIEAARNRKYVETLVKSGMNAARINCAHDGPEVWEKMVKNIHSVKKKTGRNVKICMDLGGPKLRTGAMRPGPKVIHLQPERDILGNIISPVRVLLVSSIENQVDDDLLQIPLPSDFLDKLEMGDELYFVDTRGKNRKLIIGEKTGIYRIAKCFDSSYITTGMDVSVNKEGIDVVTNIGEISPLEEKIILKKGDILELYSENLPGEPAIYDENANIIEQSHISCTLPEVFDHLNVGEIIVFDDGKIEGIIKESNREKLIIEITYAKEGGAKLRADKGINFPISKLDVKGLTKKDKQDLEFVVKNADVVNMSFVNDEKDVLDLVDELKRLDRDSIGIILKIETNDGVKNLPKILLTAMRSYPIGVMIARGDLAIEIGWKNLAEVQEEILMLCEAAHIPIVWATQVLESLAKKGRPSRAEITDAAMADRAECVMLNKGPFIFDTIRTLEQILKIAEEHQSKRAPMKKALHLIDPGIINDFNLSKE
ncbi:pyruvate kinase [Bacteroidota bacterium]